jgi:uncharacterized protein (DUF4415 family)
MVVICLDAARRRASRYFDEERPMIARKRGFGSDLARVDAHVVGPEEYEEIPELTDDWFEGAELHVGGMKVKRGRPRSANRKLPLKLRLDPDVVAAFRATGPGWQSRMNAALRRAARRLSASAPVRASGGKTRVVRRSARGEKRKRA